MLPKITSNIIKLLAHYINSHFTCADESTWYLKTYFMAALGSTFLRCYLYVRQGKNWSWFLFRVRSSLMAGESILVAYLPFAWTQTGKPVSPVLDYTNNNITFLKSVIYWLIWLDYIILDFSSHISKTHKLRTCHNSRKGALHISTTK